MICASEYYFLSSAKIGNLEKIQFIMRSFNMNINVQDENRRTALHLAAYNGHINIVEFLLSFSDINIELKDEMGKTALGLAIEGKHQNVCESILLYYADVHEKKFTVNTVQNIHHTTGQNR
jgi:ankyrin repeat protein